MNPHPEAQQQEAVPKVSWQLLLVSHKNINRYAILKIDLPSRRLCNLFTFLDNIYKKYIFLILDWVIKFSFKSKQANVNHDTYTTAFVESAAK
jgi:hypothetical protein